MVLGYFGFRGFPKLGVLFGDPYNEDCNALGSTSGSPWLGKLPNAFRFQSFGLSNTGTGIPHPGIRVPPHV